MLDSFELKYTIINAADPALLADKVNATLASAADGSSLYGAPFVSQHPELLPSFHQALLLKIVKPRTIG